MSRTYRNRKTVPKGLRVHDGRINALDADGDEYVMADDWSTELMIRLRKDYRSLHNETTKIDHHKWWGVSYYHTFSRWHDCWFVGSAGFDLQNYLEWEPGRTEGVYEEISIHRYAPQWRKRYTRKEKKWYRKQHQRQYRAKCKNLMRHGRYDDMPRFKKTGGWLTW